MVLRHLTTEFKQIYMEKPSELDPGTTVYFEIETGVVLRGEVFDDQTRSDSIKVKVHIDTETRIRDESLPSHLAPLEYQSENVFREGYTIDADEQTYTLTENNLVEIVQ